MASPYHILPVESSDLATLAEFVYESKLNLTINRLLYKDWPNEVAQRHQYALAVEGGFKNPETESLKVVDASGEIVGYLALTRIHPKSTEKPVDEDKWSQQQSATDVFNQDVLNAVIQGVAEVAEVTQTMDRYEVTYIYVKPSYRRQKIGAQLIQEGFNRAKAAGVPLVVATEPAAYDFFAKLGFKDTKYVDFDLRKWASPYSGFGIFRLAGMIWSH
ncbi:acyl-CoA N-acyltransferase [Ilyonectria sp. MPI-CAGE-AT-0026]|nr:acyl-CoA N-acyltransferase [Ilyonectria sp. MPI-CAGE-AT-0026]